MELVDGRLGVGPRCML